MVYRIHLACVALTCFALGCGRSQTLARTYPVTGKVMYKNGDPLTEGSVQLVFATDPKIVATGSIKDGAFKLDTLLDRERVPGAIEGEHVVRVILLQGADQKPPPPIKQSVTKFQVEPKENSLSIEIEKR